MSKSRFTKLKNLLDTLSLKRKIFLIVLICTTIISIGGLLGLFIVSRANNRLLYQAIAEHLSYVSKEISDKLQTIEKMSTMIIGNEEIQTNLEILADENQLDIIPETNKNLYSLVTSYYRNFKDSGVRFITIYGNTYTTYSNKVWAEKVNQEVQKTVLEKARAADGAPVWIGEDGVFLGRLIRRQNYPQWLEAIGTQLIAVDLSAIMKTSALDDSFFKNKSYLIFNGDSVLYGDSFPGSEDISTFKDRINAPYGRIKENGHHYFYVRETIPMVGWDYICLVLYDDVVQTLRLFQVLFSLLLVISVVLSDLLAHRLITSLLLPMDALLKKMVAFGMDSSLITEIGEGYSQRKDELGQMHRQFKMMETEIQHLIQINYRTEILSKEAQIRALEYQINPHFLYNTLESINWRAKAAGIPTISIMVESLGSLLRETLSQQNSLHTLERELKLVQYFMNIQQLRFENRLVFINEIRKDLYGITIPKLIIQPLVENAVKYSVETNTEACTIILCTELQDSRLSIQVKNTGSQFPDNLLQALETKQWKPQGLGIGLLNIKERLYLTYGDTCQFTCINTEEYAIAQITLPLQENPECLN